MFDVQSFQNAIGQAYTIGREIGRGGMATVYLAEDRKHDRRVAIKVVNADSDAHSIAERFQREIRLLARLQHPNILPVFDSGVADGRLWYAMPFVEGESLRTKLEHAGTLPVSVAVPMLAALADALNYAHESGVIHRDIKPENILLSHSLPLIADFGIAAALDVSADGKLTRTGMALGTPRYMSPEQATANGVVDARSDIYSLGCVGFEMLAGKPPFEGPNLLAVVARMLSSSNPPSICAENPEVDPAIERVILRAMSRDPEDRWPTAADFSAALSAALSDVATKRATSTSSPTSARVKVAFVMTLAAAAAGALWSTQRPGTTAPARTIVSETHVDSAALSAYRRGVARVGQRTQRTLIEGLALIDQAIRIDSGFALAWAARAQALNSARLWEFEVPGIARDSLLSLGLAASDRALDLDSLDANIWIVSGVIAAAVDPTRKDLPIRALRRAIALDSLNARAWIQLGNIQQELGQMDSSLASLRRGMRLGNRAFGTPAYANHFYWRRQYDSAAVWSDSAIKYAPRLPYAWELAGAAAIMRGRYDDAETYYEAALRLDQGPTRVRGLEGLAEVAAIRGDTAKALKLIAEAESLVDSLAPNDHAVIAVASAHAAVGNKLEAIRWLERYHPRTHLHFQLHVQRDPQLDPLRREPRFAALISH